MMNQSPQGFDEAKEKAAKEHAEEFAVPYGDHGYKIAFESYHTGADFGYQEGFKASKKAEYEKGYLQGLKDAKHLPTNPSNPSE